MSEEELAELFHLYDKDKSGALSYQEVRDLLVCIQVGPSTDDEMLAHTKAEKREKELTKLFRQADTDNSGTMGLSEFIKLMSI